MDIEPDDALSILVDVVFRKCRFINNNGAGVIVNAAKLDHDVDAPVSILFEDCDVSWSSDYRFESTSHGPQAGCFVAPGYRISGPKTAGSITIRGGTVRGCAGAGLEIDEKPLGGPTVTFADVTLNNTARAVDAGSFGLWSPRVPMPWVHTAPIRIIDNVGGVGGVWFERVRVVDSVDRPFLRYYNGACPFADRNTSRCPNAIRDLRGSISVDWAASAAQCKPSLMGSGCIAGACLPHALPNGEIFGSKLLENVSVRCAGQFAYS